MAATRSAAPVGDGDPQAVDLATLTEEVQGKDAHFAKIKEGTVEIVILMDCTGSMASWIEAAKSTSIETVRTLRAKVAGATFRLGFVGYRDFCDVPEQLVVVPFSEDVASVETRLRSVRATGGGDTCEDMAGGMHAALQLAWNADYVQGRDTRIVILVADAPPHGSSLHDVTVDDNHPRTDPAGRTAAELLEMVRRVARLGADLYFMKINQSTDTCIREFAKAFDAARAVPDCQSFVVLNLTNSNAAPPVSSAEGLVRAVPSSGFRWRSGGDRAAPTRSSAVAAMPRLLGAVAAGEMRMEAAMSAPMSDDAAVAAPCVTPMMAHAAAPTASADYAQAVSMSVLRSVAMQTRL